MKDEELLTDATMSVVGDAECRSRLQTTATICPCRHRGDNVVRGATDGQEVESYSCKCCFWPHEGLL